MKERRMRRRRVVTASGRRVEICRASRLPARRHARATGRGASADGFAWVSGATLLLIVLFSVYAVERPPAFPDDPRRHAPVSAYARYDLSDILTAVSSVR